MWIGKSRFQKEWSLEYLTKKERKGKGLPRNKTSRRNGEELADYNTTNSMNNKEFAKVN